MDKILDGLNLSTDKNEIKTIFGAFGLNHTIDSESIEQTTDQNYKVPTKKNEIDRLQFDKYYISYLTNLNNIREADP